MKNECPFDTISQLKNFFGEMIMKIRVIFLIFTLTNIISCQKKDSSNDDATGTISETTPEDSTGKMGDVSLKFGSETGTSGLTDSLKLSEDIGNGIEIIAAKFNIAAIKVKTNKEQTEEEKALESKELEEEKKAVDEVDEAETTLTIKSSTMPNKPEGDRIKARREKLAAKKPQWQEKEKQLLKKQKDNDASVKFLGPYIYDAISRTTDSTIDSVSLVDGSYRRIEFKLRRNFSVEDDDPLLGNVFYISGNYTKDNEVIPFIIDYHIAMNFRLRGEGLLEILPEVSNSLSIVFNMKSWFDNVDLSTATIDEDGTIYINKNTNHEVLSSIRNNIKKAVKFGKDKDGDGSLGEDETAGEGETDTGDELSE